MDELAIDVWYGKRQSFGRNGLPQQWINVLGRVYGPVESLAYSLNDGPRVPLGIGPDKRRLPGIGDFNADLDYRALHEGENRLTLIAAGPHGHEIYQPVTIEFSGRQRCPLPYRVDWNRQARIQDRAQIVDGLWRISGDAVYPQEIGYDRLIAVGDYTWRDFEVTVPITVYAINASCYQPPSVHAGVGIVLRWRGHYARGADPYSGAQPRHGPTPYGAIAWYCVYHDDGPILCLFDPNFKRPVQVSRRLEPGVRYVFKAGVTSVPGETALYRLKVWEAGSAEPGAWDLEARGTLLDLERGSILLGAHHVAAGFGPVEVTPLPESGGGSANVS
jgi:hypothetical protein